MATKEELAQEVLDYADAHYTEGGWDVVVECFDVDLIIARWDAIPYRPRTKWGAIESFKDAVSIWDDQQADAKNSAF